MRRIRLDCSRSILAIRRGSGRSLNRGTFLRDGGGRGWLRGEGGRGGERSVGAEGMKKRYVTGESCEGVVVDGVGGRDAGRTRANSESPGALDNPPASRSRSRPPPQLPVPAPFRSLPPPGSSLSVSPSLPIAPYLHFSPCLLGHSASSPTKRGYRPDNPRRRRQSPWHSRLLRRRANLPPPRRTIIGTIRNRRRPTGSVTPSFLFHPCILFL